MYTFICEDSLDGILTGVYDAWASRYGHSNIMLTVHEPENYALFQEYIHIPANQDKSAKVSRTIQSRMGAEVYQDICQAAFALESPGGRRDIPCKADAVYKTIVLGLSLPDGGQVMQYLGNPYVNRVFQLCLGTFNESHHLLGFIRFQELENGVLFSRITPKNYVLPFLADHFADRLPEENFMIFDASHRLAVLHRKGCSCFITDTAKLDESMLSRFSPEEAEYQRLWCGFFDSVSIEARKNQKLQNQNMPKRFQQNAVEFQHSGQTTPGAGMNFETRFHP